MQQVYHSNAWTNVHIRKHIQAAGTVSNEVLSLQYGIFKQTVSKWKSCDFTTAAFCAPHNIAYALSNTETALAVSIKRSTWFAFDEVFETSLFKNNTVTRSAFYRCLVRNE